MPVGRVYQAPSTGGATVARNTPVFGYNGIKSVSNSDLVITGKSVRSKTNSKSPSPPVKTVTKVSSNKNLSRKSPSPGKTVRLKNTKNAKSNNATDKENDDNLVNNNQDVRDKIDKNGATQSYVNNNHKSENGFSNNTSSSGSSSDSDDSNNKIEHSKSKVCLLSRSRMKEIFRRIFFIILLIKSFIRNFIVHLLLKAKDSFIDVVEWLSQGRESC